MACFSKTTDDKLQTYKDMAAFASDEKDMKAYVLEDLKVTTSGYRV